ncbi:MFS transporter [Terrabacter sp. 2RAF25]|uniref:MFS transporter n=1 Tax=Terrabacter sp. 2RAF25 TaxID=3232998 RepID=UPI003F96A764
MSARDARAALAVVFAATILIGLNATMLSVALPTVVGDLGASPAQGTWMLLAYLVVAGAGLVLSGQLADCLDLAAVFRAGLVAFGGASLVLVVTGDAAVFIAARAVQGAGSALMLSTAAAIVSVSQPPERRRGAMGVYLAGFAIAQVAAPLIGGLVTSALGWRWLFVLGLLIAAGDVLLGWRALSRLPSRLFAGLRVDVPGNALIVVLTTLLLVALAEVQRGGWGSVRTLVPLAGVVLAVPAFVAVERRARWPAVAVDLLTDRQFVLANVAAFCLCVGRVVPAVLFSLWFQGVDGADPVRAALQITPLAAAVTVGTLAIGRLGRRHDDVITSRLLAVLALLGSALLVAAMYAGAAPWALIAGLVVLGLGCGAFQTVNGTMIISMGGLTRAGTLNGIRATAQQSAVSVGTALLLSLGTGGLTPEASADYYAGRADQLSATSLETLLGGHRSAVWVLLGLTVVGLFAVLGMRPRKSFHGM